MRSHANPPLSLRAAAVAALGCALVTTAAGDNPTPTGIAELVAGYGHTFARRNVGTWQAWGYNGHGQLGVESPHERVCLANLVPEQ